MVMAKPPGMPSQPLRAGELGTAASGLVALHPECAAVADDPRDGGLVHRLDRGTSGLLVAARTRAAWQALRAAFADRRVDKTYLALVEAAPVSRGSARRRWPSAAGASSPITPTASTPTPRGRWWRGWAPAAWSAAPPPPAACTRSASTMRPAARPSSATPSTAASRYETLVGFFLPPSSSPMPPPAAPSRSSRAAPRPRGHPGRACRRRRRLTGIGPRRRTAFASRDGRSMIRRWAWEHGRYGRSAMAVRQESAQVPRRTSRRRRKRSCSSEASMAGPRVSRTTSAG
ncbi:MAG: RNA pseudouridine synthase [Kofleriaceae bacterium]|nr:RNA pseudouridine synthase [Kofleriaceae bacterium]